MSTRYPAQRGFAAVAAVFLLAVIAALGAYMVSISNSSQLGSANDIMGIRAFWAARAGLEWGLGATTGVASPTDITGSTCTSATPLSIDTFRVTVQCTVSTYTEEGNPRYIVQITSVAASGGSPGNLGYVERSVSAGLER